MPRFKLDQLPPQHAESARRQMDAQPKSRIPAQNSKGESALELQLKVMDVEGWQREYRFKQSRRWRFDFAWPDLLFAVEIEGVTHDGGRHQRVAGFKGDLEKYQEAMLDGWVVYRCSTEMVRKGRALEVIRMMLTKLHVEKYQQKR